MDSSGSFLRPITIFAGVLGILQSITWIALSITGIVAYYCNMDFTNTQADMGSITGQTLFHLYFHGTCFQPGLPEVNYGVFDLLNLMRPVDIHAWIWVYLMISFFWLISSITIITHVRSKFIEYANIFLYFWIAITLAVCVIDLALGILFGMDFDRIMTASIGELVVPQPPIGDAAPIFLLVAGQSAAGLMFTIVFRGFVLWIINVLLSIYFFTQTLRISDYNSLSPPAGGVINPGYIDDPRRPHPIEAYGNKNSPNLWYTAPAAAPAPPARTAADQSKSLYDERKQYYFNSQTLPTQPVSREARPVTIHTASHQQPAPARSNDNEVQLRQENVVRELTHRNSYLHQRPVQNGPRLPEPDYSPPMPRVNPFDNRPQLRSALRASRF